MTKQEYLESVKTVSIRISNSCQLRCKYCYFFYASEKELAKIVNKTFKIDDIPKIFELFPNIEIFEFWGAETLIKIDDIIKAIKIIDKIKPNIDFTISSNFAYNEKEIITIFNKIKKLDSELENKISLFIQASIDFPKENHDTYRIKQDGSNSFDICYSAYKTFLRLCSTYLFKNISIGSATKSTYDATKLNMNNVEFIIKETFKYMDRDNNDFIYNSEHSNVNINLSYMPTFFNIDSANIESKKVFLKFYDIIFQETFQRISNGKISKANIWEYITNPFSSFLINYYINTLEDKNHLIRSCYFGNVASIDYNGNIVPCHRAFTGNNFENYILGNIYTNEINIDKINYILDNKTFLLKYYDDFKRIMSKHPDFDEHLINVYFRILSGSVCYADLIHNTCKMDTTNLLNVMNVFSPELILRWKEMADEFREFFTLIINEDVFVSDYYS